MERNLPDFCTHLNMWIKAWLQHSSHCRSYSSSTKYHSNTASA